MFKKDGISLRVTAVVAAVMFAGTLFFADFLRIKETQASVLGLPEPAMLLSGSETYSLPLLRGVKIDYNNPLNLDFIVDTADQGEVDKEEAQRLINYFYATIAVPDEALWVNLSPYEEDRMVEDTLAVTDLGRDLLAQDYILKQFSSSLTYPESKSGEQYWNMLKNVQGADKDSFSKIWIKPATAKINEENGMAWISEATLTAQTEEDFLAMKENSLSKDSASTDAMRDIVVPAVIKEINEGRNFAKLRQIYHSMLLGMWFKKRFKESFYAGLIEKENVKGIDTADKDSKDKIYAVYKEAFQKGVYNLIKKEKDTVTDRRVARQYFSGGIEGLSASALVDETEQGMVDAEKIGNSSIGRDVLVKGSLDGAASAIGDGKKKPSANFDPADMDSEIYYIPTGRLIKSDSGVPMIDMNQPVVDILGFPEEISTENGDNPIEQPSPAQLRFSESMRSDAYFMPYKSPDKNIFGPDGKPIEGRIIKDSEGNPFMDMNQQVDLSVMDDNALWPATGRIIGYPENMKLKLSLGERLKLNLFLAFASVRAALGSLYIGKPRAWKSTGRVLLKSNGEPIDDAKRLLGMNQPAESGDIRLKSGRLIELGTDRDDKESSSAITGVSLQEINDIVKSEADLLFGMAREHPDLTVDEISMAASSLEEVARLIAEAQKERYGNDEGAMYNEDEEISSRLVTGEEKIVDVLRDMGYSDELIAKVDEANKARYAENHLRDFMASGGGEQNFVTVRAELVILQPSLRDRIRHRILAVIDKIRSVVRRRIPGNTAAETDIEAKILEATKPAIVGGIDLEGLTVNNDRLEFVSFKKIDFETLYLSDGRIERPMVVSEQNWRLFAREIPVISKEALEEMLVGINDDVEDVKDSEAQIEIDTNPDEESSSNVTDGGISMQDAQETLLVEKGSSAIGRMFANIDYDFSKGINYTITAMRNITPEQIYAMAK